MFMLTPLCVCVLLCVCVVSSAICSILSRATLIKSVSTLALHTPISIPLFPSLSPLPFALPLALWCAVTPCDLKGRSELKSCALTR